jgi:hypothetical protein
MLVAEEQGAGAFAARVAGLLERVEFRRADTAEDKEAIFRMRYEAYSRGGFIEPDLSGLFTDAGDEAPNVWLIAVFIDGALASSIRLHVGSRQEHWLPVTESFSDLIKPRLQGGTVIVDATRQASRVEFTRAYPFLPYITMRCGFLAEDHFGADFITATCRAEYQPAFRRMYGAINWSPPRPYPPLLREHALMAYDCKAKWTATRERYPFVISTPEERQVMFGRSSTVARDLHAELTAGQRERKSDTRQNSTTYAA